MRPPRFRLRTLMIAVAVVAVDSWLILGALDYSGTPALFLGLPACVLVPSLSLLAVAAMSIAVGLVKRGKAPPFATGYLLSGCLASFLVCFALAIQAWFVFYPEIVGTPESVKEPSIFDAWFGEALFIAMFALPQIIPALIGGALAVRLGLTIVVSGRPSRRNDELAPTGHD